MYAILERQSDSGERTLGIFTVFNAEGKSICKFDSLELGYHENKHRISCIPTGKYVALPRFSLKHRRCFTVRNVANRSNILIHTGNFPKDTLGCILLGTTLQLIDQDEFFDIGNSQRAINALNALCPQGFNLEIINSKK